MKTPKRIATLVAAAGITLATAASASAAPAQNTPPPKKGCEIQLKGPNAGQSVVYQHGYKFSILAQDNKTHTYTCDDGEWKETVALRAQVGGVTVPAGTLQLNP